MGIIDRKGTNEIYRFFRQRETVGAEKQTVQVKVD